MLHCSVPDVLCHEIYIQPFSLFWPAPPVLFIIHQDTKNHQSSLFSQISLTLWSRTHPCIIWLNSKAYLPGAASHLLLVNAQCLHLACKDSALKVDPPLSSTFVWVEEADHLDSWPAFLGTILWCLSLWGFSYRRAIYEKKHLSDHGALVLAHCNLPGSSSWTTSDKLQRP